MYFSFSYFSLLYKLFIFSASVKAINAKLHDLYVSKLADVYFLKPGSSQSNAYLITFAKRLHVPEAGEQPALYDSYNPIVF